MRYPFAVDEAIALGVILVSLRPQRRGEAFAQWTRAALAAKAGVTVELVDLRDWPIPPFDHPATAVAAEKTYPEGSLSQRWAAKIGSLDGFVIVTPEYNRAEPGVLKNAIDFLFAEWNHKAAGFVTYGVQGGHRAAESLRLVLAELHVATVRQQVAVSLMTDFEITDPAEPGTFTPAAHHEPDLHLLLDEVVAWSQALAPLRASTGAEVGAPA